MSFLIPVSLCSLFAMLILQTAWARQRRATILALFNFLCLSLILGSAGRWFSVSSYFVYLGLLAGVSALGASKLNRFLSTYFPLLLLTVFLFTVRYKSSHFFFGFLFIYTRYIIFAFELAETEHRDVSFSEVFSYLLFFPTLVGGPLLSFEDYLHQIRSGSQVSTPWKLVSFRLLWGLSKLVVIGPMISSLAPQPLVFSGTTLGREDFLISVIVYYVYIYLNFSGMMDFVISLAALLGISLPENFNEPYKAGNITDFWRRWHVTLGTFLRNVFFVPLLKLMYRVLPQQRNLAIAGSLLIVMTLMGMWHAFSYSMLLYGFIHGVALAGHHLYSKVLLVSSFGNRFIHITNSRIYAAFSWLLTHAFVAFTTVVFAGYDVHNFYIYFQLLIYYVLLIN